LSGLGCRRDGGAPRKMGSFFGVGQARIRCKWLMTNIHLKIENGFVW
jgi:hypothetical protein